MNVGAFVDFDENFLVGASYGFGLSDIVEVEAVYGKSTNLIISLGYRF